jgi:hypothetical protein
MPSANATASAYMMAAARSGLTGEVPPEVVTGKVHARSDTPESGGAGYATRNSTGVARLSRLSLGYDGRSINSDSVAHSQDTENAGDLGFARKLEVSAGISRLVHSVALHSYVMLCRGLGILLRPSVVTCAE